MPYINKEDRKKFDDAIEDVLPAVNPGELNYLITKLCHIYIDFNGLSYQRINDVMGALEGAKLEFYRRLVATYEDKKIKENGDL